MILNQTILITLFETMASLPILGLIITIGATIFFTLIITRNTQEIKLMLLSMAIAINAIGLTQNILFVIITGIIFVITLTRPQTALTDYITSKIKRRE